MKQIVTYLNFDGTCREAMTFYGKCLGAELQIMPFSDSPGDFPKEAKDRVMHANLNKGGCSILMASDIMPGMPFTAGNNVWVSVHCESVEEIERLFAAFSDKGTVRMPLSDQFWGARFGMLADRFGVQWMFNYEYPKKG